MANQYSCKVYKPDGDNMYVDSGGAINLLQGGAEAIKFNGNPATLFRSSIGGYRVGYLGDSHTANQGTDQLHTEKGFATFVHLLSKGRLKNIYYGATGGYTSQQIIDTHLNNLIAAKPDICVVLAGTNDTATGVNLNAVTKPNLIKIYNTLLSNGIIPIACTLPPRTVASTFQDEVAEMNNWIIYYCQKNGIQVVDFHSVLVDPTTGAYKTGYDIGDGIHMNGNGAKAAAQILVDSISPRLPANSIRFVTYSSDPKNIISNGCFTADTNSDGTPDGWAVGWGLSSGADAVRSLVTPTETDVIGKWFQIVKSGTSSGSMRPATVTLTPGRKYQFSGKIKVSGFTVSGSAYNGTTVKADGSIGLSIGLIDMDQSTYNYQTAYYTSIIDVTGAFCVDFVCPTGRTKCAVDIGFGANVAGTVSLAQLTLIDITDY